jgi:hypothetical protein
MAVIHQSVDHRLRDQADAAFSATEPGRIELRILADDQFARDAHTAVNDDILQPRLAADIDVGQDDGIFNLGE